MFQPTCHATMARCQTTTGLLPLMASSHGKRAGMVIAAIGNRPPGAQGT
jgi:hypothetical protein